MRMGWAQKHNNKGPEQMSPSIHLITQECGLILQVAIFQCFNSDNIVHYNCLNCHTCTGSGAKSGSGAEAGQVQGERNLNASEQRDIQRFSTMHISKAASAGGNEPVGLNMYP